MVSALQLDDMRLSRSGKDNRVVESPPVDSDNVLVAIKELSDYHISHMRTEKVYTEAEDFLREEPEELLSRCVAHVQYLFGVTSLEGLVPRMNQVYLSMEETNNFLKSARDLLKIEKKGPGSSDGSVYLAIVKRLSDSDSQN